MPAHKVIGKLFAMHIERSLLTFTDVNMTDCIKFFAAKPLFFIDVHGQIGQQELCECLEYSRAKYNTEFALIDHLHFVIDRTKDNQVQAIELFMRDIVAISLKLNIHTILIAHPAKLNNVTGSVSMNDLKGASAIKQDASNILVVWRDREQEAKGKNEVVIDAQKIRDESGINGGKKRYEFNRESQKYKEVDVVIGDEGGKVPGLPKSGVRGKAEYKSREWIT
jgi:hypothetical protein